MKKMISVVLALIMVLGLCACAGSGEGGNKAKGLQIGYAREEITPKFDVGIAGYGDVETRRNSDGFLDFIYVTCVAAREDDETVLLYTMDTGCINDKRADSFREYLSKEVGISGDRMFFGATHTHNGPDYADEKYNDWIKDKMIKVTKDAIADLSVATMSATSTQAEGMTFVRHYKMSDGSYAGANFGDWSLTPVEHAAQADEEMQIIKFDRGDESKKNVVLVNFQAHNDHAMTIGYNSISAGYVAGVRDELAAKTGCEVAFFMGASGNLNPTSRITSENHNLQCKEYGAKLGQIAFEAMGSLKEVGGSGIAVTNYTMEAEVDHSWDDRLDEAKAVVDVWNTAGKDAGNAKAKELGYSSVYHARATIIRSEKPAVETIKQSAFRIHNLGFAVGPYEMFSENGVAVKDAGVAKGYERVIVFTGNGTYIPSQAAYAYRSYESDTSYYSEGVAEKLQDKYIEMLESIQ